LFAQWSRLSRAERKQVRELVHKARLLPNDPGRFTRDQALRAEQIIRAARELPSLLPSDVPELRALWEARWDIRRRVHAAPNLELIAALGSAGPGRVSESRLSTLATLAEWRGAARGYSVPDLMGHGDVFTEAEPSCRARFLFPCMWPVLAETIDADTDQAEGTTGEAAPDQIAREISRILEAAAADYADKREQPREKRVARREAVRMAAARA